MFSPNDLKLFQFIRSAMDFKFKPGNWEKESFHGIKFDPYINFWTQKLVSARKLPEKYKNIFKDRKIFEETYKDLAFKKELGFLNNPYLLKDIPEEQGLPSEAHDQIRQEAQSISTEAVSGIYPSEATSAPVVSTPHMPTISPYQTQTSATAVLEKELTDQGGDRAENMESATEGIQHSNPSTSPRQAIPQAFEKAFENEPEDFLDPTKTAAPAVEPSKPEIKSGSEKTVEKTTAPKAESSTRSMPQIPQSVSTGFRSRLKTLSSNAQIFFQRNIGKFATAGNLGTLVSGFIGGVVGGGLAAGNPFGIAAGMGSGVSFRYWVSGGGAGPALSRLGNGIINAGNRFSHLVAGPKTTNLKNTMGKRIIFLVLGFFILSAGIGAVFAPSTSSTNPTSQTGSGGNTIGLDYTLPLRDTSIVPADIRDLIKQSFPNAKLENWDLIISKSIAAGWNPALILALWIEESGAQGVAYDDALGCAPNQPTTDIDVSLSCVFNNFSNYTNDQFDQFMARYSSGPPGDPFANNPNFPANLKSWYIKLVPAGTGAIKNITTIIAGCPATGVITTPYGFNIADYPDVGNEGCGSLSRCHNGIDIGATDGTAVKSTIAGSVTLISSDNIKGNYIEIADSTRNTVITFEHLQSINKRVGENVTQGEVVGLSGRSGAVTGAVLHYKIKRGGTLINPFKTLGASALLKSSVLTASDDISQNNYSGRLEAVDWGQCN